MHVYKHLSHTSSYLRVTWSMFYHFSKVILIPYWNTFCYLLCIQIELTLYDPKGSKTSSLVSCDDDFCTSQFETPNPNCKPGLPCTYGVTYGDGSSTNGYYVKDYLTFNQVNGNFHTATANSSIIFGWESFSNVLLYDYLFLREKSNK